MGGFDFNTVITGSGIPKDPPSSLPLGDELAVMAWARLLDAAARIAPTVGNTVAEVEPRLLDLRLEQLLELCVGAGMDVDSVESVYAFMADAEPNKNHQLMASLPPHVHLTLNIDTLLEGAGFAPYAVAHLHGRVDRPRSVMTTVSQYLEGLEPALEEQLVRATRGRSVLVVGYSGRDFDVFPTIVRAVPRRLRWLVRPGSRLSPEVEAGLTQLRASGVRG